MVVSGRGQVAEHMCVTCHMAPLDKQKAEDPAFVHSNHVTDHKVECFVCHDPIAHGKVALEHSHDSPCESCHGTAVHDLQKQMLAGLGAKGAEDCPSQMYQTKIGCNACHTKPESDQAVAMGAMPEAEANHCKQCHGTGYDGMFDGWKWAFHGYTERLAKLRDRAKKGLVAAADELEDYELKEAQESPKKKKTKKTKKAKEILESRCRRLVFFARAWFLVLLALSSGPSGGFTKHRRSMSLQ